MINFGLKMHTNMWKNIILIVITCTIMACKTSDNIYDNIDSVATFGKSRADLFIYLSENFKLPQDYGELGIQGKIIVQFVVERDGSLSNFVILKSLYPSFDNALIKVLKKMPKWNAGKFNNENVRTRYSLIYYVGR